MQTFGEWVRSQREEKKMTQIDLAAKANITNVQISNIETGKTRNPQRATRVALTKALQEDPPAELTAQAASEATIEGLGELVDFDPNIESDWPDAAGVYVLYDITQRPVYVGQSERISRRLEQHTQKFWYKSPLVEYGSFVPVEEKDLRVKTEKILIKFLKSHALLNTANTDDFVA